ncbi:ABC transporter ATP-binding protein [Paenibacillus typhae]|uniref:ABC transporter ATP-binding protein n=1 Tax=Paenibacillus typhae TaxID=1174501 RepID=UPI001C8D1807|nr:ATP-binding cassette domain-containing protein [Paenibacillus typhae]MBY0012812.1 ATP-binding cassette domain-containing protein [Paenibacillus typhae]
MIEFENVSKEYTRVVREKSIWGSLKSFVKPEYETLRAVNNISFKVEEGEILGYIGANGAGKSTSIKMMVGILIPTEGRVVVNGVVPYEQRIKNARNIGVVFGQRTQLWWDIPVVESLELMKRLYNIPDEQYKKNISKFSEILDLSDFINTPVRQLSLGQRMRADLCAAMLHNPKVLFLDEPTIGLDVVAKENIRQFILEVNGTYRTTVILTTHDMSDIEKLSHRVLMVDKGEVIYEGSVKKLKEQYGDSEEISIELEGSADLGCFAEHASIITEEKNGKLVIHYSKQQVKSTDILKMLMVKNNIKDFEVKSADVEHIVRELYSHK